MFYLTQLEENYFNTTSKMELFVTVVNGFQPLTIIRKSPILDVAGVLDPPLFHIV